MIRHWSCPVCGEPHERNKLQFSLVFRDTSLDIYRCSCGICYSDHAVQEAREDLYTAGYYDHPRYSDEVGRRAYTDHLARFFSHVIKQQDHLPGERRLLDVGCATGDFVAWAEGNGWQAEGIDISEAAIARGRQRGLSLRVASSESLFAEPESYDVITLWDVLEHVADIVSLLAALRTALKPDGLFLLKTVSCTSLVDALARSIYYISGGKIQSPLKRMYVPGHLYYFTQETLRRHLVQQGWRVILESKTDTPPAALVSPSMLRVALLGIVAAQAVTGRRYELLAACRKS